MILYLLLIGITVGGSLLGGAASGNTTRSALAVRRVNSQVNVFLGVSAHQERRNVDQLLTDANVTLADKDTCVVHGLRKVELENLSLKTSLHEDLSGKLQDIIQRVFFVGQDTVSLQSADQRSGLEQALGVLGIKGQQGTGSLADLGQHVLNTPDLTLAAETVFTAELKLLVQTFLFEGTADSTVGLSVVGSECDVRHLAICLCRPCFQDQLPKDIPHCPPSFREGTFGPRAQALR